nr:hypothetical protein [uncultured Shinella sp.]
MKKRYLLPGSVAALLLAIVGVTHILRVISSLSEKPVQYVPPAGMTIVKGSGPLGCDFSAVDSPILTGTLRQVDRPDTKIQLPRTYLPGPFYPKDGQIGADGTLLMHMQVERFTPYPIQDMRGKIAKGEDDWIMLLITQIKPLEWIAQFTAEFNSGKEKGTRFTEIPQANGLLKLDYAPLTLQKDTYVARENSHVTDVIACFVNNDPQTKLYPNCQHMTSASGIDIEIVYPMRELKNWKVLRERTRKFIACMIVDTNSLKNKGN